MTAPWLMANIGAALAAAYEFEGNTGLAAGTGDNTAITGANIDLQALGNPRSAKICIPYTTTLQATETLSLTAIVQHDSDSAWGTVATFATQLTATVIATGDTGGSTETGVIELDINLEGAKQYVRSIITPDLSASGTDTFKIGCCWVLGGFGELPSTNDLTE